MVHILWISVLHFGIQISIAHHLIPGDIWAIFLFIPWDFGELFHNVSWCYPNPCLKLYLVLNRTQEMVALSGAHTIGGKGFGSPIVFDNSYFKVLLEKKPQTSSCKCMWLSSCLCLVATFSWHIVSIFAGILGDNLSIEIHLKFKVIKTYCVVFVKLAWKQWWGCARIGHSLKMKSA